MGTLRMNGRIQQSNVSPQNVYTGVGRPSRLLASDGTTLKQLQHSDNLGADYFTATAQVAQAVGDIFEWTTYARGNETILQWSMIKYTTHGMFDIYVNGNLEPNWRTIDESGKFYVDDGGVFTDDTVDAGDVGAGDVTMLPAVEVINDACYFGWGAPFRGIRIDIGTPGVGDTGVWEYWNGAAWASIPGLVDGTSGLTAAAGNHDVTFTSPSDWAANDPGAAATETLYYVRFRVTAANFTTIPVADQVWIEGGFDDYAAVIGSSHRQLTLTNQILPGYNLIRFVVTGKHYTSTAYTLSFAGCNLE